MTSASYWGWGGGFLFLFLKFTYLFGCTRSLLQQARSFFFFFSCSCDQHWKRS